MKLFWAHKGEVIACKKRGLVNFVVINTSDWSTKTIAVPLNGSLVPFTTQSDVIMHIYSCYQGRCNPSRKIVVERIAHMR